MASPGYNLSVDGLPADFETVANYYESTARPPAMPGHAGPQATPALDEEQIDDLLTALGEPGHAPVYSRTPPHAGRRAGSDADFSTTVQVAVSEIGASVADLESSLRTVGLTVTEVAATTETVSEDISVLREELREGLDSVTASMTGIETTQAALAETLEAILREIRQRSSAGAEN